MEYLKNLYNSNFLEYASYVIKERAIPHILDGLKPVQRRILHSLYEVDDGKFNKVANVIGHCMKYHPHGDASIGEALVNLAQKEFFIDKQGNFGNIFTGDSASAPRYIECRLTNLAKEVLFNPKITEYIPSYDGRNKEPVTLPAKVPVVLLQGAEGIAVGMSTKILPHNFVEVLEAQIKYLRGENFTLYPDFYQGGIMDVEEYDDGNGKVKVRAAIEAKKDSKEIVIKEIPYGVTTESLINSIEAAAKKNKIKIAAINDYTTDRVEIEIKAARGVSNEDTIKSLYAFTDCQVSISVNCILIKENKPVNVGVSEILKYNTDVLVQLLKRELEIKLGELEDTLHYKTLEMIFIENRVYKKIEECKTYESVIKAVYDGMNKFKHLFIRELIDEDIERLLKIVIRRISRYDINKARKDLDDIVREIKKIQSNLKQMKRFTVKFINDLLKKYKEFYPRCTKIGNVIEVDKSEVALANLKLGYDKLSGTIGTSVKSDSYLSVTSYDKILVINKKGEYKVISVSDKEFVDKDVIYYGIVDSEKVFTIVYQNKKNKFYFAKRFNIDKFIMKKTYRFFAEDGKLKLFSSDDIQKLEINYAKKPKMKKLKEVLFLKNIPIKNVSVIGTKISSKEILKVKVGK